MSTVDVTPTWSALVGAMLAAYEGASNQERKAELYREFRRMAIIADRYVEENDNE